MNRYENGFDSFRRALAALNKTNKDEAVYKEELMCFHHAIEVLYKELLYQKDPKLIIADVQKSYDKAFKQLTNGSEVIATGELEIEKTIEFLDAVKRVYVEYQISASINLYKKYEVLNQKRNEIQHNEGALGPETEQIIIDLLPHVINVLESGLSEEHKQEFIDYINTQKNQLSKFFRVNYIGSINSLISLLSTYQGKDYENLNEKNLQELLSASELFGFVAKMDKDEDDGDEERASELPGLEMPKDEIYDFGDEDEDEDEKGNGPVFVWADEKFFLTVQAFWKQTLCEYIVDKEEFDKYKGKKEFIESFRDNELLINTLGEYAEALALYITELVEGVNLFTGDDEQIQKALDEKLKATDTLNLYDIYKRLNYLKKIEDRIAAINGNKNRDVFTKDKMINDAEGKSVSLQAFQKYFDDWFKNNGWKEYSGRIKDSGSIKKVIEDYSFEQDIDNGKADDLLGEFGEISTIDRFSNGSGQFERIDAVIEDSEKAEYKAIVEVMVGTESYFDRDYMNNGNERILVLATINKEDAGKLSIADTEYLDYEREVRYEHLLAV